MTLSYDPQGNDSAEQNEDQASFTETDAGSPDEAKLFELIAHFCNHLKIRAGQSASAANTAETYTNSMEVFKRFISTAYGRKRNLTAPYPTSILDDDVLLAYHDWLSRTTPHHKKPSAANKPNGADQEQRSAPADEALPARPLRYAASTIQHYLAALKRFLTWAVAQDYLTTFNHGKAEIRLKDGRGYHGKAYPHRKIDPNLAAIVMYYDEAALPKAKTNDETQPTVLSPKTESAQPPPSGTCTTSSDKGKSKNNLAKWHTRRRQIALLRNRAIVHVLFDTGLRVSELISLTRDEIDWALNTVPLPKDVAVEVVGKGGRRRTVWITQDSLLRIRDYLDMRDDISNVLFVGSKKGQPITRQMVWKVVKDGAKAAGVGDFTGPHAFRHWLARQLFNDEENPVPIEDVQALLGHASPNTTRMIYAPHSSNARLHKVIKQARKKPEDTVNN